jgi:hypothetical protein
MHKSMTDQSKLSFYLQMQPKGYDIGGYDISTYLIGTQTKDTNGASHSRSQNWEHISAQ